MPYLVELTDIFNDKITVNLDKVIYIYPLHVTNKDKEKKNVGRTKIVFSDRDLSVQETYEDIKNKLDIAIRYIEK